MNRIEELKELIRKYDYAYYIKAESLVSDFEYDKLFKELQQLENTNPNLRTSDSPTQRLSEAIGLGFEQATHTIPMLSLSNTYNEDEVNDFDRKIHEGLDTKEYNYCAEMKFDGVSISLIYENRIFKQAITRGNGTTGDDVTANIRTIRNIPLKVNDVKYNNILLTDFEVRGELYMLDSDFLEINNKREEEGEKLFANSRNLTAGSIKLLNPKEVAKRPLRFVAYYLYSNQVKLKSQSENLQILQELAFPVSKIYKKCKNINEVFQFINNWQYKRHSLGFQTDGAVVKLDSIQQQDELGNVGRSPRWAIAYKYEPETAETILNDITLQVGRTGAVTPVAELEPVFLAGSTISRATLHNADFVNELDLRIGDTVSIEKGGDVIPKVTKVILEKRKNDSVKWKFPEYCSCDLHSKLVVYNADNNTNNNDNNEKNIGNAKIAGTHYYCEHPSCPWQIRKKIEFFASREVMDISGLGEKLVDRFVGLGFLKDIADIYKLKERKNELYKLDGLGTKSIDKLLEAIEISKEKPFPNVLFALGIRFVGVKTAKLLAQYFKTIDNIKQAEISEITTIYEIGEQIATSVYNFMRNENELQLIERLRVSGLQFEIINESEIENRFNGQTFVFTGELSSMSRSEAAKKVEILGGKETKSVSKKTGFVVVGDNPGSKYNKAQELGIQILNEAEFLEMINN